MSNQPELPPVPLPPHHPVPPGYAAPVQPPKPPPLTRRQRTSALIAGGASFVLIGGSTTLLILYAVSAAAVLAFAGTWQFALGAGEDFGETVAALVMHGALYGGIFLVACGLGYGASLLILRAGRVRKPNLTTLFGSMIAVTAWSVIAGVFVMVYLVAVPPSQPWNDTTNAADQFLVVFIVALALISGVTVGALGWWLAAHLLRSRSGPHTPT